jgi:predicted aspartyl protease
MTSVPFNKKLPLIVVPVTIKTGTMISDFNFAIDTGANVSLIDIDVIQSIGYRKSCCIRTIETITASKREMAYEFEMDNIRAIGLIRRYFKIISRSLPTGLGIDGLLGLNFFKNKELTIDFKRSEIRMI